MGGSLENRARALIAIVTKAREALGADFPISVKLNSADFQKGGFDFDDSLTVAKWLAEAGVDLLEISGGTYEQPRLLNLDGVEPIEEQSLARSTLAREAYFVDFAKAMRDQLSIPIMVTGGLRRSEVMNHVLETGGADMIGLGRPLRRRRRSQSITRRGRRTCSIRGQPLASSQLVDVAHSVQRRADHQFVRNAVLVL